MFNNLSYKKKFNMVFACMIGVVLALCFGTFRKTYLIYQETNQLLSEKDRIAGAPAKLNELRLAIAKLEASANITTESGAYSHEQIFETISYFCQANQITIREYPEIRSFNRQDFSINISMIEVEGRYINIVKLMHMLEREKQIGRLISTRFFSKKNIKENKIYLHAVIYLQLVKK